MALFKSGDPVIDEYNNYSTEQLIQIVTDKNGTYAPGVVEAARSILLGRGHDYRTKEQKAAEKQLNNTNASRNTPSTSPMPLLRLRPDQSIKRNRPPISSALKGWYWIWLVFVLVRLIACLMKHS
ncbi:hypothetical protein A4H97_27140 [Niastella yeongjuensis]|uniref:Uncharacterized protein n=1 Tax=Niastella yeongjuensis TaxID=354355 RepID=A0A1V9EYW2_9BACT|nr:hypothetical protein [Niastella yeongjuensis]OQP51258.1 hypothetical protein A4H97_27140 [Niastella yeongjuensis]SEP39473.1 hypothetical protein SAMN05660816_05725 [Niastella yeongjuensis]